MGASVAYSIPDSYLSDTSLLSHAYAWVGKIGMFYVNILCLEQLHDDRLKPEAFYSSCRPVRHTIKCTPLSDTKHSATDRFTEIFFTLT